jgi:hypothetical protein
MSLATAKEGFDDCSGAGNLSKAPITAQVASEPAVPAAGTEQEKGPSELKNLQVIVFKKENDTRVEDTLNASKIAFSTRSSSESDDYNTVTCTTDVSIDGVKTVAKSLIANGIPIKGIAPSIYDNLQNRITVETYPKYIDNYDLLTAEDLDDLDSCKSFDKPSNKQFIVRNECKSDLSIDAYIRYYDADKGKWFLTRAGDIRYGESRPVATRSGEPLITSHMTKNLCIWSRNVRMERPQHSTLMG